MAESVILDTNVLAEVSRGNKVVADALNRYVKSGSTVYISRAAFDELVTRAKTQQAGGQYREMLADLRIQIAPSGAMADRVNLLADNIQRTPGPNNPGPLRDFNRKNDPTKPGDAFVAAQAKALNMNLWTLDDQIIRTAPKLGVKLAPECSIKAIGGAEDPVKGRALLGLNPKSVGTNGQVIPTGSFGGTTGAFVLPKIPGRETPGETAKPADSSATGGAGAVNKGAGVKGGPKGGGGSGGAGGAGGAGGGTTAYVGMADNALPSTGGPSARGEAKIAGIQFAFEGINFVLNLINDHIQKQKVNQALDRLKSVIAKTRAENPRLGVLLLFEYTQIESPDESLIKPGAVFHSLNWGKGATRDEALQDATSMPTISAGPARNERAFSQEVWLAPLQKSVITTAKCPFPPLAIGQFFLGNGNKAKFQLVEFNTIGGFDDVVEKTIPLPKNTNAQFAILKPPSEVAWFNIKGRQTVGVPLKSARTANANDIPVVNLDPYSPFNAAAAMCFPVDDWAEEVFNTVGETDGARGLACINFSMVRWIRAENIHLLKFL